MHRSDASAYRTIPGCHPGRNHLWHRGGVVWLRRALVVLALAAPVAVVTVVAWPDEGFGGGGGNVRQEGSGPGGAVVAGDSVGGTLGFGEVASYRALGSGGQLRIGVTGVGFDFTLTVLDEDGDQLAYNDDTNGLDPEVVVEVDADEEFTIEVRELGGQAAGFTMSVDEIGGAEPAPPTTAAG